MSEGEAPFFTIITGTRNRPDAIARMIRSVIDNTDAPFELLVADASDRLGGFDPRDPRVVVVPEPEPLGPPRGNNTLFTRARGRWVCWLNDDLEVAPGWGAALRARIERSPEVDLFCLPVVERGESAALILLHMGMPYACMGAIRRESGEALRWYDEGFSFYASDVDLAFRVIASGRRLAPAAGAHVLHHRIDDEPRIGNHAHFERDNARLRRRWRPRRGELRRRYRRTSYRYFRDLEVCRSQAWGCRALLVPLASGASGRRSGRPYRFRAPGWWLGI